MTHNPKAFENTHWTLNKGVRSKHTFVLIASIFETVSEWVFLNRDLREKVRWMKTEWLKDHWRPSNLVRWECVFSLSRVFSRGDVRISQNGSMALIRSPRGEVRGRREEDYQAERKRWEKKQIGEGNALEARKKCFKKKAVPDTASYVIDSFRISTEMILLDLTMWTSFGYLIKGHFHWAARKMWVKDCLETQELQKGQSPGSKCGSGRLFCVTLF